VAYGARRNNNSDIYAEKIPFNNAFGKLERLNEWWVAAGRAKAADETNIYYNFLENIYTELYAHLNKAEREEIDKELLEIEKYLDQRQEESIAVTNLRLGSNKCDKLARRLSELSVKYNLEWFDIRAWSREQKELEPVVRG